MKYHHFLLILICLLSATLGKESLAQKEEDSFPVFDASAIDYNTLANSEEVELAAIYKQGSNSFKIRNATLSSYSVEQPNVCAVIKYQRKLSQIGWDIMYLYTNPLFSAENQMACAGFLEGLASQQGIWYFFYNQASEHVRTSAEYKEFFDNVYENMFTKINSAKTDEEILFWQTAKLLYIQLIGVKQGYNAILPKKTKQIEIWQLSISNISGQEEELDAIIKYSKNKKKPTSVVNFLLKKLLSKEFNEVITEDADDDDDDEYMRKSRCSVFFKLLSEKNKEGKTVLQDVIASHSTWEGYSYMNRVYKFYSLPNLRGDVKGNRRQIQMSSYPGTITSTDDYFVKEGMFLVTETSISPLTNKIFKSINANEVDIPDFMRTMTSLHLSDTGKEWTDFMTGFGKVKMYSSEWMVLDFQNLQTGSTIPQNTFLIFTSSFELQKVQDFTEQLINDTYYGSFNYPELKEAQDYLGYSQAVKEGTYYKYDKDPRYEIFKFFQGQSNNITSVQWLMQYNQYNNPVISGEPIFKSPKDAIGSRWDLTKKKPDAYGEVDSKVVDLSLLKQFKVLAISGPTHQEQPIFSWATWKDDDSHEGQPQVWDFDCNLITPEYISISKNYLEQNN